MSYSISGSAITLTRGDTFMATVGILNPDGTPYEPSEKDEIRFAMKQSYSDSSPLLIKTIPSDTLILEIPSEDTKEFQFGTYVYDIQITKEDGVVDTFIKGKLKLTEEVD